MVSKKELAKWGMAAALVMATAIPATAGSWDVCIARKNINTPTDQVNIRGTIYSEFTAITAPLWPGGTFTVGQLTSCSPANPKATPVGMFFARASAVGNLPANQGLADPDLYLVEWYFRFASGGAFSTMGPVRGVPDGSTYPQTITGVFGDRTTAPGKAVITVLSSSSGVSGTAVDAFNITVP
jgi:hypothetical protein